MIKDLIVIANNLDAKGFKKEANQIDIIIRKIAEDNDKGYVKWLADQALEGDYKHSPERKLPVYKPFEAPDYLEDIEWWKKMAEYLSWLPVLGVAGSSFNLVTAIRQGNWEQAGFNLVTLIISFFIGSNIASKIASPLKSSIYLGKSSQQVVKLMQSLYSLLANSKVNKFITEEAVSQAWNIMSTVIEYEIENFKKISNDPRISNIAIAMNKALQNPSIKTNFIATVKTAVQNKA